MPVPQIDCCSGSGPTLGSPQNFQWVNYSSSDATVTNCGSWCDASSYTVAAASQNPGAPGVTNARTKSGGLVLDKDAVDVNRALIARIIGNSNSQAGHLAPPFFIFACFPCADVFTHTLFRLSEFL